MVLVYKPTFPRTLVGRSVGDHVTGVIKIKASPFRPVSTWFELLLLLGPVPKLVQVTPQVYRMINKPVDVVTRENMMLLLEEAVCVVKDQLSMMPPFPIHASMSQQCIEILDYVDFHKLRANL